MNKLTTRVSIRRILVILLSCALISLEFNDSIHHPPIDTAVSPRPTTTGTIERPRRYADTRYLSSEFINENIRAHQASVMGETYLGQWFTLVDGWRVVKDAPTFATCRIWLFGNSTIYSYELADGDTIADQLQKLTSCKVENRGVVSASVSKSAAQLADMNIGKQDIIIFMDGSLEVILLWQEWYKSLTTLNDNNVYKFYLQWQLTNPYPRAPVSALQSAITQYETGLKELKAIVDDRNLRFYHIFQPHIMSRSLSAEEWHDLRILPIYVGFAYALLDAQPELWRVAREVFPRTTRISTSLDTLRSRGELVYFDCCHVNVIGARAIASAIAEIIK